MFHRYTKKELALIVRKTMFAERVAAARVFPLGFLTVALLVAGPVLAWDPVAEPTDPVPTASVSAPIDPLLGLAPSDALLVAYTADVGEYLAHPIVGELFGARGGARALFDKLRETFDDGAMLSFAGVPANPFSWRLGLAARVSVDRAEFYRRLATDIVPAWNRFTRGASRVQFWEDGEYGHLQIVGPASLLMTVAVRDNIVYASMTPGSAEGWSASGQVSDRFIDAEPFERLCSGRTERIGALLYIDVRPFLPMAVAEFNQTLPGLYEALQLDRVEFVGAVGGETAEIEGTDTGNRKPATPDPAQTAETPGSTEPKTTDPLRVAVGVSSIEPGPWRVLASTPRPVTLGRLFPSDTTLFLHGSMERASDFVDDVRAFVSIVAKEVTDEYEEERLELARDVGFDPETEFLGNFVGEWALGASGSPPRDPVFAIRLAHCGTFAAHMHRLRLAYGLDIRPATYRGMTIQHAARVVGPFVYTVIEDTLLLSPKEGAIKRAIDAVLDGTSLAQTPAFGEVLRRTAPRTSKFMYVDVATLLAEAIHEEEAARFPRVVDLVKSGAVMGISLVPHERMIALEITSSADSSARVVDVLVATLLPSLERARQLSQRAISMANVKGTIQACRIFANDHKDRWPRSLDELVASGILGERALAMEHLSNPYDQGGKEGSRVYYLYRHISDPNAAKDPWLEVVISEPELHEGGAVFGFLDGHAEWVTPPRAEELLAVMRGGN